MKNKEDNFIPLEDTLDDIIEQLTEQMIKERFENQDNKEKKYVLTIQDLYNFSIKLIRRIKEVYHG